MTAGLAAGGMSGRRNADAMAAALARWRGRLLLLWWARTVLVAGGGAVAGGLSGRLLLDGGGTAAPLAAVVAAGVLGAVALLAVWGPLGRRGHRWGPAVRPAGELVDAAVWVETGVLPWQRGHASPATRAALASASYALITWAEAEGAGGDAAAGAAPRLAAAGGALLLGEGVPGALAARWRRQATQVLWTPGLLAIVAAGGLWWGGRPLRTEVSAPARGVVGDTGVLAGQAPPVGGWRVTVRPPAYAGLPVRQLGDTGGVAALVGSVVELRGDGPPPHGEHRQPGAANAAREARVEVEGAGWRLRMVAAVGATPLVLSRGGRRRLFVLEGVPDSLPEVTLELPARDTVLARPEGVLPIRARVRDDLGVREAHVELVISAGEGERYTATVRTVVARAGRGARALRLDTVLALGAMGLGPGDVVHLRAVARDGHPAADREPGSSETRRFRIARRGERDSLAVEGAAPPAVDTSALSQRMLLQLATALVRQRARLTPALLRAESARLARDQGRLRQVVGDVVFQRMSGESSGEHTHFAGDGHEHGVELVENKLALAEGNDGPVVAINRPLLEAYNHMWDAGRALEQADPEGALAPMRRALAAIEQARAAERLYLRGRPPTVIVDVARARLAGRDTGRTAPRPAREALAPVAARRATRLAAAARLAVVDAGAARDSVRLLRLEVLADAPALAAALEAVVQALGQDRGDAVDAAFARARRVLESAVRVPAAGWSRGLPGAGGPAGARP